MKIKSIIATAMAVLLMSSVVVMGAESPTAAKYYTATVNGQAVTQSSAQKVDGGSITVSAASVTAGSSIILTASADEGNVFSKWILSGDYEIVSGSLDDETITIIPKGDINVDAKFLSEDGSASSSSDDVQTESDEDASSVEDSVGTANSSSTSPKTGTPIFPAVLVLLAASGVCLVSINKYNA